MKKKLFSKKKKEIFKKKKQKMREKTRVKERFVNIYRNFINAEDLTK